MLAKIYSVAHQGLETIGIEVEVEIVKRAFPTFNIVGLASKAVDEARERVRVAIDNSGIKFPARTKITINLAPADVAKEGSFYDLPIAIGILLASGNIKIKDDLLQKSLFFGELSLDGSLRHTRGVFLLADFARQHGFQRVFVPRPAAAEAACFNQLEIYPVSHLRELVDFLTGLGTITPLKNIDVASLITNASAEFDMAQIIGQYQARRALEIAAAGNHNIFLMGSPGAGKTMLARAMPGIMPPLSVSEALEVTRIYSITGNLSPGESIIRQRPFRAPHHTISRAGLVGGGSKLHPGEVSLAHRGILFLDEFAEFPRSVLEALRQPIEDGYVRISRAAGSAIFASKFLLVAAANPCPCGYLGHPTISCRCSAGEIARYRKKLSGPIMDRIDLQINVPPVKIQKLTASLKNEKNESSATIQARVTKARQRQQQRFRQNQLPFQANAEMDSRSVRELVKVTNAGKQFLNQAAQKLGLSARAYFKILKIAQTIADLSQANSVDTPFIAEALQYRLNLQKW